MAPAGRTRTITPEPPSPGISAGPSANLTTQYVAGTTTLWLQNFARALPQAIDDVTRDLGADLYERLNLDPAVRSNTQLLTAAVLEDGPTLRSPIDDETDPNYAKAAEMRDGLAAQLDNLPTSFEALLYELTEAVWRGNRVAEIDWSIGPGVRGPSTTIVKAVQVKPWQNLSFVVDSYNNPIGLLARVPGQPMSLLGGSILDPKNYANLIPRQKFVVFTWAAHDGDPRGTSIYRPIYNAWWRKQQTLGEYLRYLSQFAGPSLFGTTPEGAETIPPTDQYGNVLTTAATVSPEQALQTALEALRNGTAMGAPHGTTLQVLQAAGNGEAFQASLDYCDAEIALGITLQKLAAQEAQFGTRAQASVHQDMFGLFVRIVRRALVRSVEHDLFRQWVTYNYGEAALPLCPQLGLGETQQYDIVALMTAIATLWASGFIGASQQTYYDTQLGAPQRDLDYDAEHPSKPAPVIAPPPTGTTGDPAEVAADASQTQTAEAAA